MLILLDGKHVLINDDIVYAINEQQKVNDALAIMPNFDLIKPIEEFTREELIAFTETLEEKMLSNNGEYEWDTLEELNYLFKEN